MRIFWKLVFRLIKVQKRDYLEAIQLGKNVYIVDIHKFVPIQEKIAEWENALKKAGTGL